MLFWPAAAEDYTVPRSFWDTDLGRMLALAKYRAYDPELVSIGSAAQQLGVTRPTIYRWMDDRTLNYVRDDMSGRTTCVGTSIISSESPPSYPRRARPALNQHLTIEIVASLLTRAATSSPPRTKSRGTRSESPR